MYKAQSGALVLTFPDILASRSSSCENLVILAAAGAIHLLISILLGVEYLLFYHIIFVSTKRNWWDNTCRFSG